MALHKDADLCNQESTDRRIDPLCPHRFLRSCRAVKHTRSHQSDSENPESPAHRNKSSYRHGFDKSPGSGKGLGSTGPQFEAACPEQHLRTDGDFIYENTTLLLTHVKPNICSAV